MESYIYITTSGGIIIEKRVELMKEICIILENKDNTYISVAYQLLDKNQFKVLPTLVIKGILFEYFVSTNNIVAYENINKRALEYKNKINQ